MTNCTFAKGNIGPIITHGILLLLQLSIAIAMASGHLHPLIVATAFVLPVVQFALFVTFCCLYDSNSGLVEKLYNLFFIFCFLFEALLSLAFIYSIVLWLDIAVGIAGVIVAAHSMFTKEERKPALSVMVFVIFVLLLILGLNAPGTQIKYPQKQFVPANKEMDPIGFEVGDIPWNCIPWNIVSDPALPQTVTFRDDGALKGIWPVNTTLTAKMTLFCGHIVQINMGYTMITSDPSVLLAPDKTSQSANTTGYVMSPYLVFFWILVILVLVKSKSQNGFITNHESNSVTLIPASSTNSQFTTVSTESAKSQEEEPLLLDTTIISIPNPTTKLPNL